MAHRDAGLRRALPRRAMPTPGHDFTAYQGAFEAMMARVTKATPLGKLIGPGFKQEFLTGRVPLVEGQMGEPGQKGGAQGSEHRQPGRCAAASPSTI